MSTKSLECSAMNTQKNFYTSLRTPLSTSICLIPLGIPFASTILCVFLFHFCVSWLSVRVEPYVINPRRACVRVTILGLCVCVCVCYQIFCHRATMRPARYISGFSGTRAKLLNRCFFKKTCVQEFELRQYLAIYAAKSAIFCYTCEHATTWFVDCLNIVTSSSCTDVRVYSGRLTGLFRSLIRTQWKELCVIAYYK